MTHNRYLAQYNRTIEAAGGLNDWGWPRGDYGDLWNLRHQLVREYSYAVPDDGALDTIRRYAPVVVEVGAGTGYWASLLAKAGVTVYAYDVKPYHNHYIAGRHNVVRRMSATVAAARHPLATLMLCWPTREGMDHDALCAYEGDTLVYIGEQDGGCTGSAAFFGALERHWSKEAMYNIPQWPGLHDNLTLWRRNND